MTTPVPSFLNGSSSFLQVTIKAWMSFNFSKIQLQGQIQVQSKLSLNV